MSGYTFWSSCWQCEATNVTSDYGQACDWGDEHEKQFPDHRTEIEDVPDDPT